MSNRAARVISIALEQKNLVDLMSEDKEIFGPVYKDVVDFVGEYSSKFRGVPGIDEVNDHFKEGLLKVEAGNLKYELENLRDEYVKSEVDRMLVALAKNLNKKPSSEILAKMAERANDLQRISSKVQDIDITDIDLAVEDMKRARDAQREDGSSGILTGISAWDNALPQGLQPGNSVILMGYSGKGKSFIADKLAAEAYRQGKTVLFISLEMTAEEQRSRIYSIMAQGNFFINDLQMGLVVEDKIRSWGKNNLESGGKIIVVEQSGHIETTPSTIQTKIDKYRPDLVIIDYLQLMSNNARTTDMTQKMLNLSREVKLLATSNQVACVSITAVTDDETKKRESPPRISQIAWSRGIEFDTDLAIAVHMYEDSPYMELIARKSRRSELFGLRYEVDLSRGIFNEMLEDDNE